MKKLLLAIAIATASLTTLNSCKKEYITNYLPGISYTTNIVPNNWQLVKNKSRSYYADLEFKELDKKYFDHGTVQVALEFSGKKGIYQAIPATIEGVHYSFEYEVGFVVIYADIPVGGNTSAIDKDIKAKITLTDADNGGS